VSLRKPRTIAEAHRTKLAEKARYLRSGTVIPDAKRADEQ
jgi:hypothetical protein